MKIRTKKTKKIITMNATKQSSVFQTEDELLNIELPSPDLKPGILPTEIRKLVESRRQVKSMMKEKGLSPEQMMQVILDSTNNKSATTAEY